VMNESEMTDEEFYAYVMKCRRERRESENR
jgi:hypothetical protein